ncbi:ribonuclease H-like domain-containing protein [Tanacetum coccineum]
MDLDSNQNNVVTKLPLLKQANEDGTSTSTTITTSVTTEEKLQKKNDLKARSMLLIALPNEHILTFSQYKDAKTLFEAIKARFGGNDATKKTQKILLKQMYENFNEQNLKFLRSLPAEWNTHVVVWRNKPDLDQMSFDDLYNNFKIVEQEVKRTVASSSDSGSQNVAFVSNPTGTIDSNTDSVQVNTGNTSVGTSSVVSANIGDATVYAFLSSQPNGSTVIYEDLYQIHDDDLEEMDMKWNMALLSMRERKFYQRTGRKIAIEGSDTAGYDKSKVKCFNCHKMGHFARGCKSARNNDNRARNQDNRSQEGSKKTVIIEDTYTAMVAFDGSRFDWSFMANEEAPTNMALMALSYSEVLNDKTFSNSCLKNYETLKNQYDNLRVELNKSNFDLANYKRGLAFVEKQLIFYKKNEVAFCDQIAVLKRDASFKDSEINALKIQVEKLKKDKESIEIKVDGFEYASKNLDTLVGSQISVNKKRGIGFDNYNTVAPPPISLFAPPTVDLSSSGLKEFQQPEFLGYGVKVNENVSKKSSNETKTTLDDPIIEDWESDCDEEVSTFRETKNVQTKPKQVNEPRKTSEIPRNNCAKPMHKKSGVGFQFKPKACFVCGSFSHLIKDCDFHDKRMAQKSILNHLNKGTGQREIRPVWNHAMRTNHQNFSDSRRNFVPKAVLNKSGVIPIGTGRTWVPVSTARPIDTSSPKTFVNVAKPKSNVLQIPHSPSKRPFCQQTTLKNRILNNKVNSARTNSVNTGKEKEIASVVGKVGNNAVKSSACWVWRPKEKVIDHASKNSGSYICKRFNYVDPTGRPKHMTGNKSYLTNYEDHDGGFLAFAGSTKGGKITGKGKIKTEYLDFVDVYFVKELKFNLFSVSQMCDKKNSVLFTKTKCLILSLQFKLPDENQVMLKIPRKDNMCSFDLKNIVPSKGIKREFSNARTPQQNGVAERKNRTLIEAAKTMLADSLLPIPF